MRSHRIKVSSLIFLKLEDWKKVLQQLTSLLKRCIEKKAFE